MCFITLLSSSANAKGTLLGGRWLASLGGILIFSHIRRLGLFVGVQNSEFQFFRGFQKNEHFLGGMKILWICFGGHHKIGLV